MHTAGATDDTHEFYRARGFSGRVGFGKRPAVLVVDYIVAFTDTSSPLGSDLEAPLQETLRILRAAREHSIPIFFTTTEYGADLSDAGLFPRKVAGLKWLVRGSRWVRLDARLGWRREEVLIRKKFASAFFDTGLAEMLARSGVDTVLIAGCTTSGCIRATVIDALQYGFHAIIPREAVGDRALGPHEANLFDIDAKYGDVVSIDEVLQYLSKLKTGSKASAGD